MIKAYKKLNERCKEITKKVKNDNNILGDNMLKKEERDFLISDYNAFLIGLISDQSIKAEKAWSLPYYLSKRLGTFDFEKIVKEYSIEEIEREIKQKPALHRYPKRIAEYIFFAMKKIVEEYSGSAENIWNNDLDAKNVVLKLEAFKGISYKKAALRNNVTCK